MLGGPEHYQKKLKQILAKKCSLAVRIELVEALASDLREVVLSMPQNHEGKKKAETTVADSLSDSLTDFSTVSESNLAQEIA